MKKIIACIMMVFSLAVAGTTVVTPGVSAASNCDESGTMFFSLKPWYAGLTENCEIKAPQGDSDGSGIATFVWTIVLNILYDISVLIGYITIIMIAWGGYLYMFSQGSPDKTAKGKKTLISAAIGLLIAMLASVIMNTIATILTTKS